jgi:hypothetical protein
VWNQRFSANRWLRADAFLRHQIQTLYTLREHDFFAFQAAASWICHRPDYFIAQMASFSDLTAHGVIYSTAFRDSLR